MLKQFLILLSFCCFFSCGSPTEEPIIEQDNRIVTEEDAIIFKDDAGHVITASDLKDVSGKVNWEVVANANVPQEAMDLHAAARQLGSEGNYKEGEQKLLKAHEIAPKWAFPIYDLAYTHLLQNNFQKALKYYKLTNELAPNGFFTAKTAYWALQKELDGTFPAGLYLAFITLEWTDSPEEKIQIAKGIVEKFPQYAPAWQLLGNTLNDTKERLSAIESGLAVEADQETKGVLLINKAIVLNLLGESDNAKDILGKLIFDSNTTLANIELAKYVLSSFVG